MAAGMVRMAAKFMMMLLIVATSALVLGGCRRIPPPTSPQVNKPARQQEKKPTTATAPASQPEPFEYTVIRGDTLARIADRFSKNKANAQAIHDLNPGLDERKLHAGQKIWLPGKWKARMPAEQQ